MNINMYSHHFKQKLRRVWNLAFFLSSREKISHNYVKLLAQRIQISMSDMFIQKSKAKNYVTEEGKLMIEAISGIIFFLHQPLLEDDAILYQISI